MALPDTTVNTNGSRVILFAGATTATFVIFVSATTTAFSNAVVYAVERARDLARSLRDFVAEIPRLPRFRFPTPPAVLSRIVLRAAAPVLAVEPAFVGGGLAFRRWR